MNIWEENLENLFKDGKMMMLAYDQGLEHGPEDFNQDNFDPNFVLNIAREAGYQAVVLHFGLALKYWQPNYKEIPLVLKMNGRTNLGKKKFSVAESTVKDAISIGASAVGYTIYVGGEYEAEMFKEFSQIRDEAHLHGLPVFAWMYPWLTMPSSSDDERNADIVAYGARVGAELGADVVKIKYPNDTTKLEWILKNAVRTKALLSGGSKTDTDAEFLEKIGNFIAAGGDGLAVGRNVWQHAEPLEISKKISKVIFGE